MKRWIIGSALVLCTQCLVANVKRDLGPKNTLATTAALAGDAAVAGAAYGSGAGAIATGLYGGYAVLTYGIFLFSADTNWVAEEVTYSGAGMMIQLFPTGQAEIAAGEPLAVCRGRPFCNYEYGISGDGRLFFNVSMFEPEGWSGSFWITESEIRWWRMEDDVRVLQRED